jgi:hypothetical protein
MTITGETDGDVNTSEPTVGSRGTVSLCQHLKRRNSPVWYMGEIRNILERRDVTIEFSHWKTQNTWGKTCCVIKTN